MSTLKDATTQSNLDLQEPKNYAVVIYNNDSTPMELVVEILCNIFNHSTKLAYDLTMKIHTDGLATAGIYTYEIAEQKAIESIKISRSEGYPLIVKLQEK